MCPDSSGFGGRASAGVAPPRGFPPAMLMGHSDDDVRVDILMDCPFSPVLVEVVEGAIPSPRPSHLTPSPVGRHPACCSVVLSSSHGRALRQGACVGRIPFPAALHHERPRQTFHISCECSLCMLQAATVAGRACVGKQSAAAPTRIALRSAARRGCMRRPHSEQ